MDIGISQHPPILEISLTSDISIIFHSISGKPGEVLRNIDDHLVVDLELEDSLQSSSTASSSFLDSIKQERSEAKEEVDSVLLEEYSETGNLEFGVYASYWKAIGHLLSFSILISVTLMQLSKNTTDLWLARWVTDANVNNTNSTNFSIPEHVSLVLEFPNDDNYDMNSYLKLYVELAVVNTIFTLIRAFIFAYGGIAAAVRFHKLLLKSLMKVSTLNLYPNLVVQLINVLNRY